MTLIKQPGGLIRSPRDRASPQRVNHLHRHNDAMRTAFCVKTLIDFQSNKKMMSLMFRHKCTLPAVIKLFYFRSAHL